MRRSTSVAGRSLVVRYDAARLPQCREMYQGMPAWQIDLQYRVDGGAVRTAALTAFGEVRPTSIDVPAGATTVETWFRVTGQRSGCTAYDSDFGRNYTFTAS